MGGGTVTGAGETARGEGTGAGTGATALGTVVGAGGTATGAASSLPARHQTTPPAISNTAAASAHPSRAFRPDADDIGKVGNGGNASSGACALLAASTSSMRTVGVPDTGSGSGSGARSVVGK